MPRARHRGRRARRASRARGARPSRRRARARRAREPSRRRDARDRERRRRAARGAARRERPCCRRRAPSPRRRIGSRKRRCSARSAFRRRVRRRRRRDATSTSPRASSAGRSCSRRGAWDTTDAVSASSRPRPSSKPRGETSAKCPSIAEQWVRFVREVSLIAVQGANGERAFYPLAENVHRDGILARTRRALRRRRRSKRSRNVGSARCMSTLDYRGVLTVEFFLTEQRAARERDGAARPQLRPLDDRRRGDEPVREPSARRARLAARLDSSSRPRGDAESARRATERRIACSRFPAHTSTTTARAPGPGARSATARSSTTTARGCSSGSGRSSGSCGSGMTTASSKRLNLCIRLRPYESMRAARSAMYCELFQLKEPPFRLTPGSAVPVREQAARAREGVHGVDDLARRRLRRDHGRDRLGQDDADRELPRRAAAGDRASRTSAKRSCRRSSSFRPCSSSSASSRFASARSSCSR